MSKKNILYLTIMLIVLNTELITKADITLPKATFIPNSKDILNERTFSGPMGMGLIKSYEYKGKKFCVYNNIKGQKTFIMPNVKSKCPKNLDD